MNTHPLIRWAAVAGTVASIALVSACSSPTAADPTPTPGGSVSVWIQNGAQSEAIQSHLETWGEENDTTIEVTVQASDSYLDALQLALKTGKGPDVFDASSAQVLAPAGFLQPLSDVLSDDDKAAYASALQKPSPYIYNDETYAVPTTADTTRLAYNKEIFENAGLDPEAPPTTFSEVVEACEAIEASGQGVYCFGLPLKWVGWASWMLDPAITDSDSDLTGKGIFNVDTQEYESDRYAPGVELYRSLITNGWAYPGASSLENDAMRAAFANGEIAMFVSASWDVGVLNETNATKVDWAAGAVPVPDGEEAVRQAMNAGTPYAINAASENASGAAAVLNVLIGEDLNTELGKTGLTFPIREDAAATAADSATWPQYADYAPSKSDEAWFVAPTALLNVQGENFRDALARLILGAEDIDAGLDAVSEVYNTAFEEAITTGLIDEANFSRSE